MRFPFPAEYRLKRKSEFQRVFEGGRKAVRPSLVLIAVRRPETEPAVTRLGLVVSRKTSKRAVKRNRVRRRFKEVFRLHHPCFQPGFDIIVISRASILNSSYQQIRDEFLSATRQLGILTSTEKSPDDKSLP